MREESSRRDLSEIAAKIDALEPGPELDARSAQLLGWEIVGVAKRFSHGAEPGSQERKIVPRFSSDIAATFELEEHILAGEHAALYIAHLSYAVLPESGVARGQEHISAIAHAPAHVRCRAALKAVMRIPAPAGSATPAAAPRAFRSARPSDDIELL